MIATNDVPQITMTDAAKRLNVSWKTVNRWCKSGRLMAVKIGGRYRTTEKWILALMQPAALVPVQVAEKTHGANGDPEDAFRLLQSRFGITKTQMPGSELRGRSKKQGGLPKLHGRVLPRDASKEGDRKEADRERPASSEDSPRLATEKPSGAGNQGDQRKAEITPQKSEADKNTS